MFSLRALSIKRKLTLIIMTASSVALLLVSAGFVAYELVTSRQTMLRDLSTLAQIIGNQSTAALTYQDKAAAEEILRALSAKQHIEAAAIYKGNSLFARYPADVPAAHLFPPHPEPAGSHFERDRLTLFRTIFLEGEPIGTVYLKSDLAETHQRLQRYAGIIVLFMVASWLITYLLSVWLQRIISAPIFHLAQTAKAVSTAKNYSLRAHKRTEDELGQLIDGFNEMLTQIQQRDAALQQANDDLEKRVAERTRDLEWAYNELRRTQATIMQQERLKALGQMASGIAHDINNALSPVVGFADLLARSEPSLSQNGSKFLRYIKTAGEDIAHIVARLRNFYRRRDEREALAPVRLNHLVEQVIDMTRPRSRDIPQGRGMMVEVRSDLDAALPEIAGIESEVREALTNLILNAVDAVPTGGNITLRTRVASAECAPLFLSPARPAPEHGQKERGALQPTHVVLEVADTGIGMDEKTRERCLEPFFSTKGQRGT